jgi:hypothetical protein
MGVMNKFELYDSVKILNGAGQTIKEGVIVQLGSSFARVCDFSVSPPFADIPEISELYPYSAKERKMIKLSNQRKKSKRVG